MPTQQFVSYIMARTIKYFVLDQYTFIQNTTFLFNCFVHLLFNLFVYSNYNLKTALAMILNFFLYVLEISLIAVPAYQLYNEHHMLWSEVIR
jgi:hypothetical protein